MAIVQTEWCPLFNPLLTLGGVYRFKGLYGGRAGMKTSHIALALLNIAEQYNLRILCAREVQNSIDDSVHQTLADFIERYELNFTVTKNKIVHNKTKSEFIFKGLLKQTINSLKSLANIDIAWLEEAHSISQRSWDILIPTIRNPNSEIWFSWNPEREDDPVWDMFIKTVRDKSWIKRVNYSDNPWFKKTPLYDEMKFMKKHNYSKYMHIWEGEPITDYDTLVYRFKRDVNITTKKLVFNDGIETCASWDFGVQDDTAIIFYQILTVPQSDEFPLGYCINVFDEYVNNNQPASHYREVVDDKKYLIDTHYCDPSGKNRDSSLDSWVDKLKFNKQGGEQWRMEWTHRWSVQEMIDATNDIVPYIRYNQHQTPHFHKACFNWQMKTDKDGKIVLPPKPNHDAFSHVGTSLYYMVACRFPPKRKGKLRVV